MNKIFLDCGANNGCSLQLFTKVYVDYKDFIVYSFECSNQFYEKLIQNGNAIGFKEFHPVKKAVWISDGMKKYDGWQLIDTSTTDDGSGVKSLDFSKFLTENFSKDDYIILKMDIEGAEYKVVDKMFNDGTLSCINEFYGELHGQKKGYTEDDNVKLLSQLSQFGLNLYNWDALDNRAFEKIQIVPFGTEGSYTNASSNRVGHAYKKA